MKKYNKINTVQKIGLLLIFVGFWVIFPDNEVWYHDLLQIILGIGLLLFSVPIIQRMISRVPE